MGRIWRPVLVGAAIAVGVFLLAQAQVFEPSASTGASLAGDDVYAGQLVFERECAACHGPQGEGDSGPRLEATGLGAEEITSRIRQGSGVMPAGLVSSQDEADVVAYVVSIAGS